MMLKHVYEPLIFLLGLFLSITEKRGILPHAFDGLAGISHSPEIAIRLNALDRHYLHSKKS
jgi:hypothetical protein